MRMLFLCVLIFVFVLLVLTYKFKVKVAVHANLFEKVLFIATRAFSFTLFAGKFEVNENGEVVAVLNSKKKNKKPKPLSLLKVYFLTLAKRLKMKKSEWFFTCGSESDASFVSVICGYILSLNAILTSVLLERFKHIKIYNDIDPIYNEDRLEVSACFVVSFCLLDVIVSLFVAYYNYFKIKEKKNV